MSSALNSNPNRASLLSGLRTGGVRPPMTAAPNATTFTIPEEQYVHVPQQHHNRPAMTAAVDGPNNRFSQQQQNMPQFAPMNPFQMQAMQLEMLKLQAMQAQQYQAELLAQNQRQQQQQQRQLQQQQQQQQNRRTNYQPPASAGPAANMFDLRSATLNAQLRRANQAPAPTPADLMQSQLGGNGLGPADPNQVPMTASLGGKFGSRSTSVPVSMMGQQQRHDNKPAGSAPPPTPNTGTTVISGGTSLGNMSSNNVHAPAPATPSKSDAASSWRRGGTGNSALNSLRDRSVTAPSPAVKITPPPLNATEKRSSPPLSAALSTPSTAVPNSVTPTSGGAGSKFRPKPLSFNAAAQQPMIPSVLIDTSEAEEEDDSSSASGTSSSVSGGNSSEKSSPTTSNELLSGGLNSMMQPPLSPREEASKRLYEGLGIGRPRSRNSETTEQTAVPHLTEQAQPQAEAARAPSVNMMPPQTAALFPSHQSHITAFPQSPFGMAPMPHTASLTNPNYMNRLDRHESRPKRQPKGPPSGADELGPKNFATRSNRLPPTASLVGNMPEIAVEVY